MNSRYLLNDLDVILLFHPVMFSYKYPILCALNLHGLAIARLQPGTSTYNVSTTDDARSNPHVERKAKTTVLYNKIAAAAAVTHSTPHVLRPAASGAALAQRRPTHLRTERIRLIADYEMLSAAICHSVAWHNFFPTL